MTKRFVSIFLNFLAGLAGNLLSGWIQQDIWNNLFTPIRIVGTIVGVIPMLVLISWLESSYELPRWLIKFSFARKITQFFRTDDKPLEILVVDSRGDSDNIIIQRAFNEVGRKILLKALFKPNKSELAFSLREGWDIVHLDCNVGSRGQIHIEDGEIEPQVLRELLIGKNIKLLVLMSCDSLRVVSSANSAGVETLIAVTGSLPLLAAEEFCYGLYRGIARGQKLSQAFSDAKALASVNLTDRWDSTLFVLDMPGLSMIDSDRKK